MNIKSNLLISVIICVLCFVLVNKGVCQNIPITVKTCSVDYNTVGIASITVFFTLDLKTQWKIDGDYFLDPTKRPKFIIKSAGSKPLVNSCQPKLNIIASNTIIGIKMTNLTTETVTDFLNQKDNQITIECEKDFNIKIDTSKNGSLIGIITASEINKMITSQLVCSHLSY